MLFSKTVFSNIEKNSEKFKCIQKNLQIRSMQKEIFVFIYWSIFLIFQ